MKLFFNLQNNLTTYWCFFSKCFFFPTEPTWLYCSVHVDMCNNNNIAWSTSRYCIRTRGGDELELQQEEKEH